MADGPFLTQQGEEESTPCVPSFGGSLQAARDAARDALSLEYDDPDEPRGSVVADAHKCWAQAHVSCAESFIATRRIVPTCTEKDAH